MHRKNRFSHGYVHRLTLAACLALILSTLFIALAYDGKVSAAAIPRPDLTGNWLSLSYLNNNTLEGQASAKEPWQQARRPD
jgi:hypothetical protein